MGLQIIGAGFGRTGTHTLKLALEQLGAGPCYHMVSLLGQMDRLHHWEDAAAGRPVDWEGLFDGYAAAVDYPASGFWRELHRVYPRAKVILTHRDPDAWWESVAATIFKSSRGHIPVIDNPATDRDRLHNVVQHIAWDGVFEGRFLDRDFAIRRFVEHSDAVRREVPAEQLLVYEVSQGWEPLCAFLGVEVPPEPLPRSNTRREFTDRMKDTEAKSRSE